MIRATRESSSLFVSFVDHRVLITRDLELVYYFSGV